MSVVCTTSVVSLSPVDLQSLRLCEFVHKKKRPDRRKRRTDCFRHVILRNPIQGFVYLVYENGKCVILGPRSWEEIGSACSWIQLVLCSKVRDNLSLRNIVYVYTIDLKGLTGERDDVLPVLFKRLSEHYPRIQLDQELSPALMLNPKTSTRAKVMIFRTGRVNITGITSFDLIEAIKHELESVLK